MIDLYTFATPNGRKISVMLEEVGLPYAVHVVDITRDEQFKPEFLKINPNNKIPAIVDHEGPGGKPLTLFESGAILFYLGEKTGKLLPASPEGRYHTLQWLMFQMGGVGPMMGQLSHFTRFAKEKIPYAIERYTKETQRLLGVMDRRLAEAPFLAGEYSIADVATYPWVAGVTTLMPELLEGREQVKRWLAEIGQRPAVQKGMQVPGPRN
ncbi:MAG: glutathione S-transferase N-terminal domain-containing protein [Myxococcales bacterium]